MSDLVAPNDVSSIADLPLQPSGSGVADLEIAYEQMKLADNAGADSTSANTAASSASDSTPREKDGGETESEAHPS